MPCRGKPETGANHPARNYHAAVRILQRIVGGWQLLRLLVIARGRLGGGYLAWRRETAFGTDPKAMPPAGERLGRMLDYGYWVHCMRRGGRRSS